MPEIPLTNPSQFRILYREFLFRLMDVEVLSQSAQGDANELLGQFGSLLIFTSIIFSGVALGIGGGHGRFDPDLLVAQKWGAFHVMVSTTMLVVGLFAVLGWDATFLDRRDVMVLAPLPVRGRTMFLAKISAVAAGLAVTVGALNWASGTLTPLAMVSGLGFFGGIRLVVAYWATLFAGGAFVYCALLGVQGLIAQLPRRWFLRVSSWLQIGSFALLLGVYFLEPSMTTPKTLAAPENHWALAWFPPHWFLGLFSESSGSFPAQHRLMAPLANRAVIAFSITIAIAAAAFLISYFRTLRKIVEEPDILPTARGATWLPPFGNARDSALVQFAIRSLLRSRQHRMILAFYLGFGFAMVALYIKGLIQGPQYLAAADVVSKVNPPMLVSSVVMLVAWLLGTRVVFTIPLDLRANWIFRVTPLTGGAGTLPAARRSLLALAVAPVWAGCAAVFFWTWPWRPVAAHLATLALFGSILADVLLYGFRKIPFTCSYLPGKSKVHLAFWFCSLFVLFLIELGVKQELGALRSTAGTITAFLILAMAALVTRRITNGRAKEDSEVLWEESRSDELVVLGLSR